MKAAGGGAEYVQLMSAARATYKQQGDVINVWLLLFNAAEVSWTNSTPRRHEQRKLALQLRQLTGRISSLHRRCSDQWSGYTNCTLSDLRFAEFILHQQLATIEERIPA